jgi:hypothetical protein
MKLDNPSYDEKLNIEQYDNKILNKELLKQYKQSDEHKNIVKDRLSLRMRLNNPMKDFRVSEKVTATIKRKIANGELVYKRGKEHPLFTGYTSFKRIVKYSLSKWIKSKLEQQNYTCQKCNRRGGYLHVHHIEPFRDIIKKFLIKNNTNINDIILGDDKCNMLVDEICKYHIDNPDIGMVVCEKCHEEVDKHFHMRKKHRKYYENN